MLRVEQRRLILLPASLFFYGYWNIKVLLLLIFTVLVNYLAARGIERLREGVGRRLMSQKALLFLAVSANLLCLGFFKYYNFFTDSMAGILGIWGLGSPLPVLDILLPVGISFYTFQITAYTVDVYRENSRAEKSFWDLLLFCSYFPQLVAGPIERAGRLLPLLKNPAPVTYDLFRRGAMLALWGIFKKVYIADNLSQFVDIVLIPGIAPPTWAYFLGACVFAVQIYADFSGYTDVARGVSRMLGIELVLNFNLPFISANPSEFWRRWHITLGAFLRDYIYIPLGGNRHGRFRQSLNLMIVWTLGGLWHGASIGFLVWGMYCGALVVLHSLFRPMLDRLGAVHPLVERGLIYGGRVYTFLTFAHGLLLFRVTSIEHLVGVLRNLNPFLDAGNVPWSLVGQIMLFVSPLLVMQVFQAFKGKLEILPDAPVLVRVAVLALGLVLFVALGAFNRNQFFYFQF